MSVHRNRVRIERTRDVLDDLREETEKWLSHRTNEDERGQYSSQLEALGTFLTMILDALRVKLDGVEPQSLTSTVYHECRDIERRLIWLRGAWGFFRRKFDQRDDKGQLGEVLGAADEIMWSCYAGFYQNVSSANRRTPPLPYIEPLYVPNAIPRDEPWVLRDPAVAGKGGEFFKEFLEEMPIPVIGLPQECVDAPWWLIYIGHEVGHHIQHDLQVIGDFGDWLQQAAEAALPAEKEKLATKWKSWGQEVFADTFSVYTLGTQAVWAITELLLDDERTMLTEIERYPAYYPATVVRLALMAEVASGLKLNGEEGLRGLDPRDLTKGDPLTEKGRDLRQQAKIHLGLVPEVAQAIYEYDFAGKGQFESLCGWKEDDFAQYGTIYRFTEGLRGRSTLYPRPDLGAPRLIISAALDAWAEIGDIPDAEQRADAKSELRSNLLNAVAGSRPEGKRSAEEPVDLRDVGAKSEVFVQKFLETSVEELGL